MKPDFDPHRMLSIYGEDDNYSSPDHKTSMFPTPAFMTAMAFGPLRWLWQKASQGKCDDTAWSYGSAWLARIFENVGGNIIVEGLNHIRGLTEPVVIIANHMSTLETFLLPGIIRPIMPVTFIVKKSLVTMPIFGPIMRSRDPVVVERKNPREDLATVLEEGVKRLQSGISVIVFPQHTRSLDFNPDQFNSIGIKLARKANARVVPLALKTDAWGQGRKIKELGKIRPDLPAHFRFGQPMGITGTGKKEHAEISEFINSTVTSWKNREGVNR